MVDIIVFDCFTSFDVQYSRYYCIPVAFGETKPGYYSCPAGFFCPNGTGLDWQPCPAGTYSNQLRLYKVSEQFCFNTFFENKIL